MYIALKWLISFSVIMWLSLCGIDVLLERSQKIHLKELSKLKSECSNSRRISPKDSFYFGKNIVIDTMPMLHYMMFFAGALLMFILRKKDIFLVRTKNLLYSFFKVMKTSSKKTYKNKRTIISVSGATLVKYTMELWTNFKLLWWAVTPNIATHGQQTNKLINEKLAKVIDERNKLQHQLNLAITENRNMRLQYQKETMAKQRFEKHVEETQKQMKENKSKYMSFHNLYLITHQENLFLKECVRKISTEKEKSENNLMSLIKRVHQSKNPELRAFCANFMVKSSRNLLNCDASVEIEKFLQSSSPRKTILCDNGTGRVDSNDDLALSLMPECSDAPKVGKLPGEYVWTVKDNSGTIEKLFEYQCESDSNNGDTIRRIRQYSVYWEKDCVVDVSTTKSILNGRQILYNSNSRILPETQNFLTGSEAFKKFIKENKSIVSTPKDFIA